MHTFFALKNGGCIIFDKFHALVQNKALAWITKHWNKNENFQKGNWDC